MPVFDFKGLRPAVFGRFLLLAGTMSIPGTGTSQTIALDELISIRERCEQALRTGHYVAETNTTFHNADKLQEPETHATASSSRKRFAFSGEKRRFDVESDEEEGGQDGRLNESWAYNGSVTMSLNRVTDTGIVRQGRVQAWDSFEDWFHTSLARIGSNGNQPLSRFLKEQKELYPDRELLSEIDSESGKKLLRFAVPGIEILFDPEADCFPVRQRRLVKDDPPEVWIENEYSELVRQNDYWFPVRIVSREYRPAKEGGRVLYIESEQRLSELKINEDLPDSLFELNYDKDTFVRNEIPQPAPEPAPETVSQTPPRRFPPYALGLAAFVVLCGGLFWFRKSRKNRI